MRSLLILVLFATLAAPARAGTYEHHTLPSGLDGWSPGVVTTGGFVATGATPDRLWMGFWARPWFEPGELAEWVYTAPEDTTIAGWGLERAVAGVPAGDWNTLFGEIVDGRWHHAAWDVPSVVRPWGAVGGYVPGATRLVARLVCGGPHICAGPASMELRAARFALHDGHAPAVSEVQGELADERVLAGAAGLSFAAADRGGGVYRAVIEVDGVPGEPVLVGDGRCRDAIAGGDPYQFAHRRPCPLQVGASMRLDTTRLAEGRHVVAVHVEDAAGNRTPVYGPAVKIVDNVPAPSPPASSARPVVTAWLEHRGRRRAVTVRYGTRVRLRGRVTDGDGGPLRAAPVEIAAQPIDGLGRAIAAGDSPGDGAAHESWPPAAGVRTRADGRFTAFIRVGPSRRLRIAAAGETGPQLTVWVRAPLTVHRRGRRVEGRLLGAHVPRGGALVELQTRAGRRWITRRVVRTSRSGRFAGRLGRAAPVRVRVPRQAGLPYATGLARLAQPSA
jgi:hypothetical protein